jgi:hypothetical protein
MAVLSQPIGQSPAGPAGPYGPSAQASVVESVSQAGVKKRFGSVGLGYAVSEAVPVHDSTSVDSPNGGGGGGPRAAWLYGLTSSFGGGPGAPTAPLAAASGPSAATKPYTKPTLCGRTRAHRSVKFRSADSKERLARGHRDPTAFPAANGLSWRSNVHKRHTSDSSDNLGASSRNPVPRDQDGRLDGERPTRRLDIHGERGRRRRRARLLGAIGRHDERLGRRWRRQRLGHAGRHERRARQRSASKPSAGGCGVCSAPRRRIARREVWRKLSCAPSARGNIRDLDLATQGGVKA